MIITRASAWAVIALAVLVSSCTSAPAGSSAARAELAPAGKLRVGLILSNQVLVTRDSSSEDRADITIAVPERSAPDLFLSRNLRSARVLRVPGGADGAIQTLTTGKANAYAENAHMLSLYAERLPGARVLEGRFTVIQQAVATPKGRAAAAEHIRAFVEEAKLDGTVAEAIRAAGLRRTRVAPPSSTK